MDGARSRHRNRDRALSQLRSQDLRLACLLNSPLPRPTLESIEFSHEAADVAQKAILLDWMQSMDKVIQKQEEHTAEMVGAFRPVVRTSLHQIFPHCCDHLLLVIFL
jgi:hypothetical protein